MFWLFDNIPSLATHINLYLLIIPDSDTWVHKHLYYEVIGSCLLYNYIFFLYFLFSLLCSLYKFIKKN
jgi:hypothetical protein